MLKTELVSELNYIGKIFMFLKETRPVYGTLLVIFLMLMIGAGFYGIDTINNTIVSINNSTPWYINLGFVIFSPLYFILLPCANDPLFLLRKSFIKGKGMWVRDDSKPGKEPFFWERRPSLKKTDVTKEYFPD